jgi:hypothetical protein
MTTPDDARRTSPYQFAEGLARDERTAREQQFRDLSAQNEDLMREVARLREQAAQGPPPALVQGLAKVAADLATLQQVIHSDRVLGTTFSGVGVQVPDAAITALSSSKLTGAARADTSGNAILGTGALAVGATNGFAYIPTIAGVPVGAPTAITGFSPIVADPAANIVYLWDGAAWQPH